MSREFNPVILLNLVALIVCLNRINQGNRSELYIIFAILNIGCILVFGSKELGE